MSFINEEDHMVFDEDGALAALVSGFSSEMTAKLLKKSTDGWTGWMYEYEDNMSHSDLVQSIKEHAEKGDWVDVANLAAFAWNLGYCGIVAEARHAQANAT